MWGVRERSELSSRFERAAVARMQLGWDIVARAFPRKTGFMLGRRPHVCDIYLANLSRWWKMRDYLKDKHPSFAAMMGRVDRLPLVAPIWKRHWS